MRVLMLTQTTPYLPTHDRARLAPAYLLAHLAARHAVAVIAPDARGETPAQQAWAAAVAAWTARVPAGRWRHPLTGTPAEGLTALREAALHAVVEWAPDLVHLEGTLLAPLAAELPLPLVLSCRESRVRRAREACRLARGPQDWMRAHVEERIETEWERRWLPAADACVVASEHDRQTLAERMRYDRIDVIPPGIDEQRYEVRRGGERARLVFAGNLAWPSHLAAARRLATRVLPRVRRAVPGAELLVAGGGPLAALRALAALPGVRMAGATGDPRPSLWSGAVALIPAEAAPAIDAAILESMAVGTPVVTAPRCLSGLDHLLPGQHLIVAEDDAEMADAAVLIMREPVVAATLTANARQVVERRHTWAAVARSWEALWGRTAGTLSSVVAA
jgi:glycosyltransferase involved in cell wall biosynthesis